MARILERRVTLIRPHSRNKSEKKGLVFLDVFGNGIKEKKGRNIGDFSFQYFSQLY